jgi:hypothetical protein
MSKPMVRIHNTDTDEIIDREMTAAEFTQHKKDEADYLAYKAELQSQATAKAALLERLGITADEAKLLLS